MKEIPSCRRRMAGLLLPAAPGMGCVPGVLLLKLDSGGRTEWNRTFLAGSSGQANAVRMTSDGGYVITGSVQGDSGTGSSQWDGYILKTDDQGIEEWSRSLRV